MTIELIQEIGTCFIAVTEDIRETAFLSIALQKGNAVSFKDTMITE